MFFKKRNERFKKGNRCIVVDIHREDGYFSEKEQIIGKEVIFDRYRCQKPRQTFDGGFIKCYIEPLPIKLGTNDSTASCFRRIKLKKIS